MKPDGAGDEGERDDERQRAVADPVGRERGGDAGGQARRDGRAVALLGDLAEVLEGGDGEDDDDERERQPTGRHSVATMNSAASTTPASMAAGRLRPAAGRPAAVRAGPAGRPDALLRRRAGATCPAAAAAARPTGRCRS